MQIAGIALIIIGILFIAAGIYYMRREKLLTEIKEYRTLMEATDSEYEPPKPIERMYEKKPINSFIGSKEAIVPEEDLPEMDLSGDDETVIGDEEEYMSQEEDTSLLDESTSLLEEEETSILEDESTSILDEETSLLEEETSILDDEETSLLDDFDSSFEEEGEII